MSPSEKVAMHRFQTPFVMETSASSLEAPSVHDRAAGFVHASIEGGTVSTSPAEVAQTIHAVESELALGGVVKSTQLRHETDTSDNMQAAA